MHTIMKNKKYKSPKVKVLGKARDIIKGGTFNKEQAGLTVFLIVKTNQLAFLRAYS